MQQLFRSLLRIAPKHIRLPGSCEIRVVPKAAIIHFLIRSIVLVAPICFGGFLGTEGNAIGILLFSLGLLIFTFLFRRWIQLSKNKIRTSIHYRRVALLIHIVVYALILVLCRSICPSFIGLVVLHMADDSVLSSSSESSFELQVLLEPWPDEPGQVQRNLSQESSLRQRVLAFGKGNEESPFLMGKTSFAFFQEVEENIKSASTQREYNRILDFENRDLQIREQKRSCYSLFEDVLRKHPALAEKSYSNPQEAFLDFFAERRDELDDTHQGWSTAKRDMWEIDFLSRVRQDLRKSDSIYIKKILGIEE